MENTDEIIGSLLGERNAKGMELLFDTYYRTLVLWSNSIVNDISQSEDIVQELFVRIWERHLISETVPANLKSYLFTAVRNLSLNASRKYNPLREAENINTLHIPNTEYSSLSERRLRIIEAEIEKLPPRTREILRLVYLKNLQYRQVAENLGISIATVKTLLVHALKELRMNCNAADSLLLYFFVKKIKNDSTVS